MSLCSSPTGRLMAYRICRSLTLPGVLGSFSKGLARISASRPLPLCSPTLDSVRLLPCCLSKESELASCLPTCAFTHGDHTFHPGEPGNPGLVTRITGALSECRLLGSIPVLFWYWEVAGMFKGSVHYLAWLEKTLPQIMRLFEGGSLLPYLPEIMRLI